MSTNFSTNQYEGSFLPHKLQNYEVPQQFKQHPSSRKGQTQIITNDRGHIILPNRKSSARPWGHFVGTWQAPRKPVQLKVKTKMMSSSYQPPSRPVSAPASVTLSQKQDNDGRNSSSPEVLQSIEELAEQEKKDSSALNRSLPTSSNGSRPNSNKSKSTQHSSPLPQTPQVASGTDSPVTNRPDTPTPSDRTKLSPSVNSTNLPHETGIMSRASSAPPSRLSQHTTGSRSRTATPTNRSATGTPAGTGTRTGSGSSYRPHSRQGSYEGSGIGTSHGLKVYTPFTPEGTTRSHTAAGSSCNTPSIKDKEIQCPSI